MADDVVIMEIENCSLGDGEVLALWGYVQGLDGEGVVFIVDRRLGPEEDWGAWGIRGRCLVGGGPWSRYV